MEKNLNYDNWKKTNYAQFIQNKGLTEKQLKNAFYRYKQAYWD